MRSEELPADTLALILAFYRRPLHYPELLRGRGTLPEEMNLLLRVAGGEIRFTRQDDRLPGTEAEKIRKAAVFFIEQVCLSPGANYYRVLGLDAGAGEGQIKAHHRLLMRLFHPDRQEAQEDWTDAYAGRINQAYNVLRRPALRKAYDASLPRNGPKSAPPSRGAPDHRWQRLMRLPKGYAPAVRPSRALGRRFPQLVLAVAAVLVVLGIYLLNAGGFSP